MVRTFNIVSSPLKSGEGLIFKNLDKEEGHEKIAQK